MNGNLKCGSKSTNKIRFRDMVSKTSPLPLSKGEGSGHSSNRAVLNLVLYTLPPLLWRGDEGVR
jgi:hypothetical protein